MDLVIPRRDDDGEESLASFVRRRLGREALDRLVQPLVAGIYTADPNDLSLKATLPQFLAMEREHGSLILAGWRESRRRGGRRLERQASGARYGMFVTLADGMDTLPDGAGRGTARRGRSAPARPSAGSAATSRSRPGWSSFWTARRSRPTPSSSPPRPTRPPGCSTRKTRAWPSSSARSLTRRRSSSTSPTAATRSAIPLDGFGAVVPAIEGRSILAVSFLSVKFPNRAPAGTVLLRVFIGGATHPEQFDLDDQAVTDLVRSELGDLIGASGEPLFTRIGRHPRSMPQYNLGHLDRVATIRRNLAKHSRLYLAGIAYDGVGIPDCIHAAEMTADSLLDALANPAASAA